LSYTDLLSFCLFIFSHYAYLQFININNAELHPFFLFFCK